MHLHTGTHMVAQLFGMSVNLDTIFTQWLTALIVFIIVFAASRGRSLVPSGIQNAVEMIIEPLCSQFEKIWDRIIKGCLFPADAFHVHLCGQ